MTTEHPVQIGEGFAGDAPDLAHVNTVLGPRAGAVGTAFASALAQPAPGHVPFLVVVRPGVAVQPPTLFVNKATVTDDHHGRLTWGAAQAGVAEGVVDALAEGVVPAEHVDGLVLVCAVWVDPAARDAEAVRANNRAATLAALRNGARSAPPVAEVLALRGQAWNPYLDHAPED